MCHRMKPCPTLEYALILLVVVGLIGALCGLARAVSQPLNQAKQALEEKQ